MIKLCPDFRSTSRVEHGSNEGASIWIHLMTGQHIDRKKISSHVQVIKTLCRPAGDLADKCRSCIVSQLHDHVQGGVHQLVEWASPETCQFTLAPWAVTRLNASIERLVDLFDYAIDDLASASGNTGHERGVADQVTKKTVQEIQNCTWELIEGAAQVTIRPSAGSEDHDVEDGWDPDGIRSALSDRLTRLQEVAETLTIEQASQRFVSTWYEVSPPTACRTVRAISPGLDQLLRVGANSRNQIIIQRSVSTRTGGKIDGDRNGRDVSMIKQQGPWMSAKVAGGYCPYLRLEFDDFEALKVFTEGATKLTQKSVTVIELEYDPSDEDLTADAVIDIVNTKLPKLRTFCTSVLPVRRFAAASRVWGRYSPLFKEGDPRWWMEREIAYFKALENVTARVCLLFRWKSDADWFAHNLAESGKWRSLICEEGAEGFGKWIFDRRS